MKVLLLSAYDAESHRYWRSSLQNMFADWQWTSLVLPPRYFNWRIRGNSLVWSQTERERLSGHYDACIATSMVDLATLRGLVPKLATVPTILYFHENQFAYPRSEQGAGGDDNRQAQRVDPQMVQLYSALAADRICFNSEHNRDTFCQGLSDLLAKLPDHVPTGIVEGLLAKHSVVPVPLAEDIFSHCPPPSHTVARKVELVWNHRWEYDKGPERLLAFIKSLPADLTLKFHILGQSFRRSPACFSDIEACLSARGWMGRWGYIDDRNEYIEVLARAHVVLSTALHDFQGLSVLEAMALGCRPMLPRRLSYPEFVAHDCLYEGDDDTEREADNLKALFLRSNFATTTALLQAPVSSQKVQQDTFLEQKEKLSVGPPVVSTNELSIKEFSQLALQTPYRELFRSVIKN